ncbi:hypothetical protein B0H19DRAFT_1258560 [Mycena capillaripes]|nr:hypothetical protein B0H19DRAFT_1258560 [Mycena capillaripes]
MNPMNLMAALLVSFAAVVVANPVPAEDFAVARNCQSLPFLICTGGINQEIACTDLGFQCPTSGLSPVISDATCEAQCVCDVPCP